MSRSGAWTTTRVANDTKLRERIRRLVANFLADRKPRTYAAYGHDLDEFASFRGRSRENAIADLLIGSRGAAAEVALAYAVHLRRHGRANATVSRRLGTLRAFAGRAHEAGLVEWNLDLPTDEDVARAMWMKRDVPYLFPRHETEIDRLDIQHYALHEFLGGNYRAPLRAPARVLDVGCGSGQWAYDLCQEFPGCLVVGYDLATTKPGQPENFAFVRGNLLQGLPFAEGTFDYVHQRLLAASAIPLKLWSAVVAGLVRVTCPGGWVELVESGPEIESAGPATDRLFSLVRRLGRAKGLDTTSIIVGSLADHLTRAGLVDVNGQYVELPVGEWGGRAGTLLASGVRAGMTRLMDSFEEQLGIADAECRSLIQAMSEEWDQYQSRARFTIAFGRKPAKT